MRKRKNRYVGRRTRREGQRFAQAEIAAAMNEFNPSRTPDNGRLSRIVVIGGLPALEHEEAAAA